MPRTVEVSDAKARFSHLIARAEAGEVVIIARDGIPVARIAPVARSIEETIALMRHERSQWPRVAAADIRAATVDSRA